ncbi:unnamed protein product, partial [Musa banksii]
MMSSNAKLSEFFGPSPNFYPLTPRFGAEIGKPEKWKRY